MTFSNTATGFAGPVTHITGPAGRLAVREQPGHGLPLVLIHGVNMNALVWADVVAQLPGRRVLAVDLRGHGDSDHRGPYSPDDWIEDVQAMLDRYEVGYAQFAGTSLGGMLACVLAQRSAGEVQSVVTFGSALRGDHPDLERGMARLRQVGVEAYFASASPLREEGAMAGKLAEFAATPGRQVATVEAVTRAGFLADFGSDLHVSGRPVRVVSGELDRTCPPEAGRALAAAVGGEWILVPGAGHVLPVEAPHLCAAHITELAQKGVE